MSPSRILAVCISLTALADMPTQAPVYAMMQSDVGVTAADRAAVIDIIARMNLAIDSDDYPAYAQFYTEDGIIDSGFGPPVEGRAAIVQSLEQSRPFIVDKRHVAANHIIEGDGQALRITYYLTVFERKSGLYVAGTALITDEFRREHSGWKVVRHTTRMDPATLSAMAGKMQATEQ